MSDEIFKAFVGGLPYDSLASDIETLLSHCQFTEDDIRKMEIHLVHDRDSGNFKGFAYVTFPNEEQVENAIKTLNGVEFAGRVLKVNRAQQRDRNDRGGRGGRGGGFGGDRGGDRGGRGGFRRGGGGGHRGDRDGGRFNDGGHRGGHGSRNYRQRNQSEASNQQDHPRNSEEGEGPAAPRAERPRLNLKPRTTDATEIEARKKREEEETKKRQEKLFG